MQLVRFPSLALRWCANLDKTIPMPKIIYADTVRGYSGCFVHPMKAEILFEGVHVDARRGVIIVSPETEHEANTLAHEFRHLWQYWRGWANDCIPWPNFPDYKTNIIQYFTLSKIEMDALLWSQRVSPAILCEEWLGWIRRAQ